jgi:transcriptional regulator with XRE-family HTH domain
VSNDKGADFRARREAIGISKSALADRAGVDRGSIAKIEAGERVLYSVVGAVDKALSQLEHEYGMDLPSQVEKLRPIGDPSEGLVEFEVGNDAGIRVVVKGPVKDLAALQATVLRLTRELGKSEDTNE